MRAGTEPCCDERIGHALRGALTAADWSNFATHLSTCVDCRAAWCLAADFRGTAGAVPGDENLVARAARAALASTSRAPWRVTRLAVAGAATLVIAGVASGAMMLHIRRTESRPAPARAGAGPGHRPTGARDVRATPTEEPKDDLPPPPQVAVPGDDDVTATRPAPSRPRDADSRPVPRRQLALLPAPLEPPPLAVAPIGGPSADEAATLLERAVTARRDGHLQAAIGAFRRLQADFPGTPEGLVSQVSVGDLFLRLALPAEALAAFEAYLRAAPTGALVPEALAGRARALAALGRETESRATWRELARRFSSQSSVGRRSGGTARVGE